MYETLYKLFYKDKQHYNEIYSNRINSDISEKLDFMIHDNPAFFMKLPELYEKALQIEQMDKQVRGIASQLPNLCIDQFTRRCLIDEIVLSNNIEGVHSTRREIDDVLRELKSQNKRMRFNGLVNKYNMLISGDRLKISGSQDIRDIYDELVLPEVIEEDPDDAPDGILFRKDSVSVESSASKEIHRGIYPESKIIEAMDKAIALLNEKKIIRLFSISLFHYFFGYIHPFYDGNGRTSRFITSYLLSKELIPIIGFRISYTIQEHINDYYEAFKICNDPRNKGDLTPFIEMFIEMIQISMAQLIDALDGRLQALIHFRNIIPLLPGCTEIKFVEIYDLLIQATLFSEHGITMKEMLQNTNQSRNTIKKRLDSIRQNNLLIEQTILREKYYNIDLDLVKK